MGTDKELGERHLALPSSRVAEYKARQTPPPADVVAKIARGANVDPGWLGFGELSRSPAPKGFQSWLSTLLAQEEHKAQEMAGFEQQSTKPAVKKGRSA
jgi:hypothetical protein